MENELNVKHEEDIELTIPNETNTSASSLTDSPPSITLESSETDRRSNILFDDQLNNIITVLSNDYLANTHRFETALASVDSPSRNKDIQFYLDYLNELKEPMNIIHDDNAVSALIEIGEIFKKDKECVRTITDAKFQLILKNLFDFFYKFFKNYVEKEKFDINRENSDPIFNTFHLVVDLTETLVVGTKEFDSYFYMTGGIKCLLNYFCNQKLISYFTKCFTASDPFRNERKANYCDSLAAILNILLYLKFNRVHGFKKLNVIEVLTEFSNKLEFENFDLVLRAHFILANLCTRKQVENLKYYDLTLIILERTVQLFAQACQKNSKYTFFEYDLYYDGRMITFEINLKNSPNSFIMIILFSLQSFLVKDDVKYRTFYTIKNSLIILSLLGDYDEKFLALSLLFFFSFDEVLSEKLLESTNLLINLEQTLLQSEQIDESIYTLTVCLRYILNKKQLLADQQTRISETSNKNEEAKVDEAAKKILLTYHDSNELICMRIKLELEKRGYVESRLIKRNKIIPVSNINGCLNFTTSTIGVNSSNNTYSSKSSKIDVESVMRSIEQSDILVVCMSSLYEFSEIAQYEVFYAKLLGKRILPVNIQSEYLPDYWLDDLCEERKSVTVNLNHIKVDILKLINEIRIDKYEDNVVGEYTSQDDNMEQPLSSNKPSQLIETHETCKIL